MVKRCVAAGCGNSCLTGHSVHLFPVCQPYRRQWVRFVQTKRADFKEPSPTSEAVLCGDHFGPDCFVSILMNSFGLKKKRTLKTDAIPTIHARALLVSSVSKRHSSIDTGRAPVKQRRAVDKLFSARRAIPRIMTTDTTTEEAENTGIELETETADERCDSFSIGTQCSAKRPFYRSKETSTERVVMVNATTQTETLTPSAVKCQCLCSIHEEPDSVSEEPHVDKDEDKDPTYEPGKDEEFDSTDNEEYDSDMNESVETSHGADKERKYIVFESELLELFTKCPLCDNPTRGEVVKEVGSLVNIQIKCDWCQAVTRDWNSQPYSHKMPQGNLVASAAILVAGCLPSQALRMFTIMNVAMINRTTYFRHQRAYVIPTIVAVWRDEKDRLVEELREMEGDGLEMSGDGRSDSPGHCAKFGGYTIMEQRLNKIIDLQLVQSNEVANSNACELEGLKRCVHQLTDVRGLALASLVTDRHMQINAYIRDDLKRNNPLAAGLLHYYDVWHVAKDYTRRILAKLLEEYNADPIHLKNSIQDLRESQPPALATAMLHPNKDEARQHFMQRFPNM